MPADDDHIDLAVTPPPSGEAAKMRRLLVVLIAQATELHGRIGRDPAACDDRLTARVLAAHHLLVDGCQER